MGSPTDRPAGFLTEKNREFLTGEGEDYTRQNKSYHRNQIKKRLRNAVLDFTFAFEHMDDSIRREVFGDYTRPYRDTWKDADVESGMRDLLAFVLREAGVGAEIGIANSRSDVAYKELLYGAVERVGENQGKDGRGWVVQSVSLDIEASRVDIERLKMKLEKEGRESLTYKEIGVLASEGELPEDF